MSTDRGAVLITGASSGMGRACALRLARAGYTVFAGVRKKRDAQSIAAEGNPNLVSVILDVTDQTEIAEAVRMVSETVGSAGLRGLVNNAGTGIAAPIELLPLETLRRVYDVNVLGQVAVTQAFLPLIRAAKGRIINVGSVGGKIAVPFGSPISSSKAALESLSESLRMELRYWGIHVILVAPGSIHTPAVDKLARDAEGIVNGFSEEGRALYEVSYRAFVDAFVKLEENGIGPEAMAETVLTALTVRRPRRRYPVGPKSRLLPFMAKWLPAGLLDIGRTRIFGVHERSGCAGERLRDDADTAET